MMSISETRSVLEKFFNDCLEFWKTECDEKEALINALNDVRELDEDPYSHRGELDMQVKQIFIHFMEG